MLQIDGSQFNYTYDALNQLTNENLTGTNAYNATYTYDGMGNRLTKEDSGAFTSYTYNAANAQVLAVNPTGGPTTNTFDANGNLTVINVGGSVNTYTWDPENRQTVAVYAGAAGIDTFTYDANGKRQTDILITGSSQYFIWDGENQFALGGSGDPIGTRYTDFPGYWGGLSSFGQATGSLFLVFDMSGNCRLYVDPDGVTVTDIINYHAFGEEFGTTTPNARVTHFGALFGGWHDSSGQLFNLFRNRWQYPSAGVWTSRDPLGIGVMDGAFDNRLRQLRIKMLDVGMALPLAQTARQIARTNQYQYSNNNPVIYIDPSGMAPAPPYQCPACIQLELSPV